MLSLLVEQLPSQRLGVTRIGIGVATVVKAVTFLPVLLRLTQPEILRVPAFSWMPIPTDLLVWVLVGLWVISGVMVTLGVRLGVSAPVLLACLIFTMSLDQQLYSNHLYLMTWLVLLLIVADAGAGLALHGESRPVVRWAVLLIPLQISIVYGFTAVTKINPEFLSGEVLAGVLRDGLLTFPPSLVEPRILSVVAAGAVLAEAFLAFALWSPRLRRVAYVVGFGLHGGITLFMEATAPLLVFSLLMFSTYPLFASVAGVSTARPVRSMTP